MLNKDYWEKVLRGLNKCLKSLNKSIDQMEWQRDYTRRQLNEQDKEKAA